MHLLFPKIDICRFSMDFASSPLSGLSVEIRLADKNKPGLDVRLMKKELHRMKMELIGSLFCCFFSKLLFQNFSFQNSFNIISGALDNCGIEGMKDQVIMFLIYLHSRI